jgi:hypothetical protein
VVDCIRRGEKRNCASLTAAGAGPGERETRGREESRRKREREREGTEDLRLGRDECDERRCYAMRRYELWIGTRCEVECDDGMECGMIGMGQRTKGAE